MDYRQAQRNPAKHLAGITFVLLLHVIVVYALVNGLARKVVEVIKGPLETKIIEEVKAPPPDTPPPPPKLAPPPPPSYIPPPEVQIAVPMQTQNTISVVTDVAPPKKPVEVYQPKRTSPVIDAKRNCRMPEYPPASRRMEEQGAVTLGFLIGVDGKVLNSKVETSSGFQSLDDAAIEALSRCRFIPGTVDGKPEQSWGNLKYVWKLR